MSSYKGAMANYYHEARAQVKKIKVLQEENKKRAERRAEIIDPVAPNPLQQLRITGMSCKLLRSADAHAINESGENLVPWNGQQDNMIDRFDVRALLDFYKEPDARVLARRQKTHEEQKLEEILRFESYRDLVRLMARGLTEPQGLKAVEQDVLNRRAAEHAAMQAATDQVYYNKPGAGAAATGPGTSDHLAAAAGTGVYSAMGFSYDSGTAGTAGGGTASAAGADISSDDESSDDSDDGDDEAAAAAAAGPVSEADLAQEAEDERIDDIAEAFGLADFSYRLHRAFEKEGEEEARMRKRPKKRMSRKKAANRAKRMTGMGLDPATGLPLRHHDPYKDPRALINPWQESAAGNASPDRSGHRRDSPSYDAGGWRTRDRSTSPARAGERQYITEFVSFGGAADRTNLDCRTAGSTARAGIIEALPDRPDPAQLGGIQPVAREAMTLQGIKREDLHRRLRQAAEDDSPTYRRRSPTPPWRKRGARSRSRSNSRGRSRSRDRRRDRSRSVTPPWLSSRQRSRSCSVTPPWRKNSKARSRSHSRSRSRNRQRRSTDRDRERKGHRRSRSRSRSRDRYSRDKRRSSDDGAKHNSSKGGRSSYSSGVGAGGVAPAGASVGGSSAAAKGQGRSAAAGAQKETPQERLKRLMQAQLNKAAQKDSLANAHKKIQAEKDKVAREQIERVALAAGRRRSPSPGARNRSHSPPFHRSSRRSHSP